MANPLWPAALPQFPLAGSLQRQVQDGVLRFQPDVGQALRRARWSGDSRTYSFAMVMDATQMAIFESFYFTTLKSGALDFDWIDPATGTHATFSFTAPWQEQEMGLAKPYFKVGISLQRKAR